MRLHIDCSYTRLEGSNVGITRVVRGLARGLAAIEPGGIDVRFAVFHRTGFRHAAALEEADADEGAAPAPMARHWRRLYRLSGSLLARRLVKMLVPATMQVRIWRRFSRLTFSRLAAPLPRAEFRPGDVLVLGDASWSYDVWSCAEQAAKAGARVVTIVYDLIPLNHAQFCAPAHRLLFEAWLLDALRHSDAIMCISEATRTELEAYCTHRRLRCPPSASFRLGGELPPSRAMSAPPRESIQTLGGRNDLFMTVGSIEPRKCHDLMLDAFDQCWRNGVEATLVVIGRPSDGTQATVARMRNHALLDRRLFLITDCSDLELDYLYRRARAVVLASQAEGFGLPLAEARQRGCQVIASRIPAFKELADAGVRLFTPGSRSELAALVSETAATPAPPQPFCMPEFSWRDCALQFTDRLARVLSAPGPATPRTYAPRSP